VVEEKFYKKTGHYH